MRIVLVSMNIFGHNCLEELIRLKKNVAAVITLQDDLTKNISDYKSFDSICEKHKIPLHKIKNINTESSKELLKKLDYDIMFVFGWSQIIKEDVVKLAKIGAFGIHPAILPKNRGRAAIPWQIINNETEAALSLFYLAPICDGGDIAAMEKFPLTDEDTAWTFYQKVMTAAVHIIRNNIDLIEQGKNARIKQDEAQATYLSKRTPDDGYINWNWSAKKIYDLIRAVSYPYPGAFTYFKGKKLIIWKASHGKINHQGTIGQVVKITEHVAVQTGDGHLFIEEVQEENGEKMAAPTYFTRVDVKLGLKPWEHL